LASSGGGLRSKLDQFDEADSFLDAAAGREVTRHLSRDRGRWFGERCWNTLLDFCGTLRPAGRRS
jgi:hypothetical protein